MHHSRLPLHSAAEFLEGPQERRLQAAHQGNGVALSVHNSILLAGAYPVARRLSRPAGLQCEPAASLAPIVRAGGMGLTKQWIRMGNSANSGKESQFRDA